MRTVLTSSGSIPRRQLSPLQQSETSGSASATTSCLTYRPLYPVPACTQSGSKLEGRRRGHCNPKQATLIGNTPSRTSHQTGQGFVKATLSFDSVLCSVLSPVLFLSLELIPYKHTPISIATLASRETNLPFQGRAIGRSLPEEVALKLKSKHGQN